MEIVAFIIISIVLGLLAIAVVLMVVQCCIDAHQLRKLEEKTTWKQPKNDPDFTWTDDDGNECRIEIYKGKDYWVWTHQVKKYHSWGPLRYSDTGTAINGCRITRRRAIKAALAAIPKTVKQSETRIKDR